MYLRAGLEADRVHVVPNGVDLERFAPEGPAYDLGPAGPLRFLFVGGAIGRKGVDVLVAAWQQAFGGRDDVQLVIKDFGSDGVYRGADRSAVRALAESGALVYLDADLADDEMAALYRACDVLVHPYRGEGFAMPVLEAMACGLPAITTTGCGVAELLSPASGHVVDAFDEAGLAAAMTDLLRPEHARALGAAARRAIEPYSLDRMTDDYLALYARLMRAPADE
jgi:glycosyltransferase involved in cell wall biosynthesis